MRGLFRTFTVMAAALGSPASAQDEVPTEIAFSSTTEADETVCLFKTASFDGQVINGRPQDFMEMDALVEIEEMAGAPLSEGNIDMVKMTYSMCGSGGHVVTEHFDRVQIMSFLDDELTLAPEAVEAFTQAGAALMTIPCDEPNLQWIYGTLDEDGDNLHTPYCPAVESAVLLEN